jgi:hypothetical protein
VLTIEPIRDLARLDADELVTVVAVAEQGKIVVLPSGHQITTAMLVNGPQSRDQIHALGKGRLDALLVHGQSVLVRGWLNDCSDGERRFAIDQAVVAGSDGYNTPHTGHGHDCALCEHDLEHSH